MTRCAIAIDDASQTWTQEEETLRIQADLIEQCGDVFTFVDADPQRLTLAPACDLLVVDFGGLGIVLTASTAERCAGDLHKAVERRPGTLFMVWSRFTTQWYLGHVADLLAREAGEAEVSCTEAELRADPRLPPNVVLYPRGDVDSGEFEDCWAKVRGWLGLSKPGPGSPEHTQAQELRARALQLGADHLDQLTNPALGVPYGDPEPLEESLPDEEPPAPVDEEEFGDGLDLPDEPEDDDEVVSERPSARVFDTIYGELEAPAPWGEKIGEITVPIYAGDQIEPDGTRRMHTTFKLQDCLVTLGEAGELASFGGLFTGHYELRLQDPDTGEKLGYLLDAYDLFAAAEKIHRDYRHKFAAELAAAREENRPWPTRPI